MLRFKHIADSKFSLYIALRLFFKLEMIFDGLLELILLIVFRYLFFILLHKDAI